MKEVIRSIVAAAVDFYIAGQGEQPYWAHLGLVPLGVLMV